MCYDTVAVLVIVVGEFKRPRRYVLRHLPGIESVWQRKGRRLDGTG